MRYALDVRTHSSRFPGIGRYVGNLARALAAELAPDERLLLIGDPRAEPHWDGARPDGEVEWVDAPVSPFSLRQQWLLPSLLQRVGASLYHSPYYLMPYRVGLPTVVTIQDLIPERHPESVSAAARWLSRTATKLALASSTHVLTPSESTRDDLLGLHRLAPERVTVIPFAASRSLRPASEAERRRVRVDLGLPERYVLHLGSDRPHKNLKGLLAAWALLGHHGPALKLLLAGPGDRTAMKARATPDSVAVLGPVAEGDLAALLSEATLFVLPSLAEGFGLPVLEAMACGVPVLCSDRGALREVAGDAAIRFDPERPRELADAMARALADDALRADLARRGLARAGRFDWRRTARLTLDVYRRLDRRRTA